MASQNNGKREQLMTVEELARYCQVSVATVYRWNSEGTGPQGRKIGRYVRYHPNVVDEWFKNAQPSG